jgi:hypothetical protein
LFSLVSAAGINDGDGLPSKRQREMKYEKMILGMNEERCSVVCVVLEAACSSTSVVWY